MSLADNPQRPRRTLSLPGYVRPPADALPRVASHTGATTGGHQVPAPVPAVPPVLAARCPLPLRIGVLAEFLVACPAAKPGAVSGWLRRWTSTTQYRRALAAGGMRFDLAGNAVEPISAQASAHAAELLAREAAR